MTPERRFLSLLSLAMSNSSLYSPDHEMAAKHIEGAVDLLGAIPGGRVEIMILDGDLVLNKVRLRKADLHGESIVRRFAKRGLSWAAFARGVDAGEVKGFISDTLDGEGKPKDFPHISAGTVGIRLDMSESGEGEDAGEAGFTAEQIEVFKEVYAGLSPFRKLEVTGLEEIVAAFVVAIRQEANILRMISPVKSYSEYTYTHAVNVSLLSMCQAELLGVGDALLREIGVAALMHDVGKLFISREVLHKKGRLGKEEFAEMTRHPVYGAYYLAGTEGMTRLAPIAAFEHHRKFDGSGYPDLRAGGKGQHVCSQIVAISDFFDALRSNRPYREGWSVRKILGVMREGAGTDFNPFLLANMEAILTRALGPTDEGEV